ncbi:MAG: glutamine-hydrolyzing GMP synthase [Kiritimatiellaeota bacterium]|nr:glutamine-hydrolyzing GMP synthase [Kiritimatiellota bacterium]
MARFQHQRILILDFGSQYTQLIARRVREARVYSEIVDSAIDVEDVRAQGPAGLILSGGPAGVHDPDAPGCDPRIFDLGIPILGICYGLQWMSRRFGGEVRRSGSREYGRAELEVVREDPLFAGLPNRFRVWMSHADEVERPAPNFHVVARSNSVPCAALAHDRRPIWGVQFHPEVVHTKFGKRIIRNFARRICGCRGDWTPKAYLRQTLEDVRAQVGENRVICGLSGGVDSSVAATLLHQAIGANLTCIFVDNGLLRHREAERLLETFRRHHRLDVRFVDAADRFLDQLEGVTEPEMKRKIIGHLFIDVFRETAADIPGIRFLAQGTTYPDLIESSGIGQHAEVIKSHHNVGGLPEKLGFELVEPLRMLFKDEVRALGKELDLPDEIVWRQPFPGPGLAVRVLGEVTRERLEILRQADRVVIQEIKAAGWYRRVWQSFAVLLPVQTVGVMGDGRTYENAVALRVVHSTDGMTADWVHLPHALLETIATRITNEVHGVNRVVYDITSKPPGTIEWE